MAKISFEGIKDPARRPRYIIWAVVAVLGLAAVTVVALGITSTYWFCANGCHKVQDDTIIAYDASSHSEVSCMACHMPTGAGPVTFLLHKMTALGELYLTVTDTYSLPLNAGSHLAMNAEEMGSKQCTQCHTDTRVITPSPGILIDHVMHEENEVHCTVCHNRVAHPEDFELTLPGNKRHDDFMTMTACFRCHSQKADGVAPGACSACHPADFELKPPSHFEPGFYQLGGESSGHARLALNSREAEDRSQEASPPAEEDATPSDSAEEDDATENAEELEEGVLDIPSVSEVDYCETCHAERFCVDCHGLEMPHPPDFQATHGELGRSEPAVCANCHAQGEAATSASTEFCNTCHHPESDPTRTWISQHFEVVRQAGADACFDCHNPTYCAECHVGAGFR